MSSRLSRTLGVSAVVCASTLALAPVSAGASAAPGAASSRAANSRAANYGDGSGWGASGRVLAAGTRFYVPPPAPGSLQQILQLVRGGDLRDALRLAQMEATPQAVWF